MGRVFADAVDAVQAVGLVFDALINEIDLSKMRVFLADVLFDREQDGSKNVTIPFGKQDCTVFRKVMSTEGPIQEFALSLRTNGQIEAFRVAPQMLGDLTGFGINYFDMDDSRGYVKTAIEVSSDNAARCPHGRPDPRHTAPLPMARPNPRCAALAWPVRTARRQINSAT